MPIDYQKEPWRESLFDICASPKICCKGTFCLECLFGENARNINGTSCCLYCCGYFLLSPLYLCGLIHIPLRAKMREKYGLQEVPNDCVAGCLCSPCAVCQEAREIISRERSPGNRVRTDQPKKNTASPVESEVASAISSTRES